MESKNILKPFIKPTFPAPQKGAKTLCKVGVWEANVQNSFKNKGKRMFSEAPRENYPQNDVLIKFL